MKSFCLFLVVALAYARSETVDINENIDKGFEKFNSDLRKHGKTSLSIPRGQLSEKISFSNGFMTGFDSIQRTGDCTLSKEGNKITYELHYGVGLAVFAFGSLKIDDDEMSGYFRVRNNSIKFLFNVETENNCKATIDEWIYEDFSEIEFGSSRKEYDSQNLDKYFAENVQPFFQKWLDASKSEVEKQIEKKVCKSVFNGDYSAAIHEIPTLPFCS